MTNKVIPLYENDSQGGDDPRPLPLIIAEMWGFSLQNHDTSNGVQYAIQDWVAGLASDNMRKASQAFQKMENQMSISIQHLKYKATDGKYYSIPFTNDEGLYQIAAYMRATKSRPALKAIKEFLAKAGVFADLARREPETVEAKLSEQRKKKWLREGKAEEWIAHRDLGVVTRKQLMAIVKHILDIPGSDPIYGQITNDTYRGVFGMSAVEMRQYMGIPSGANVREFMSTLGIIFTSQAEEMCRIELEGYQDSDIVQPEDVRNVVVGLSRFVGKQVKETSHRLGRDVLTGRKFLSNDDTIA